MEILPLRNDWNLSLIKFFLDGLLTEFFYLFNKNKKQASTPGTLIQKNRKSNNGPSALPNFNRCIEIALTAANIQNRRVTGLEA
jgi:hypothetical protein